MLGRRSFLALLGAAPAAAKSAAVEAVSASQGVTGVGVMPNHFDAAPSIYAHDGWEEEKKALEYLLKGGWPDHVDERCRRESKTIVALDADLVANRSFSWSTKLRLQGERNYRRAKADAVRDARNRLNRKTLPKWLQQLW